jgi:DNA-binding PadR family transcriptional regulator
MFYHVILGCLRDGKPRHGYDVWIALRARTGLRVNLGNVYRELSKLVAHEFIDALERPSNDDARRNPYGINDNGCRAFDEWLASPATQDDDFSAWLSFIDHVPSDELLRRLERVQERLWLRSKALTLRRDDALGQAQVNGRRASSDLSALRSLLELKRITATVEFVDELRRAISPSIVLTVLEPPRRSRRG